MEPHGVADGLHRVAVTDLTLDVGPDGAEALQRHLEAATGECPGLALGVGHVLGRLRGRHHDVESGRAGGHALAHLAHQVLPTEGLVGDHEVTAHSPHLLHSAAPRVQASAH